MPSVSLTWHTMHDDRVCPICQSLEGKTWEFTPETGVPTILENNGRIVWDENSGSAAHGHQGNCRCHLTAGSNLQDLIAMARKLRDDVEAKYGGTTT
jgi:hypothetical protein